MRVHRTLLFRVGGVHDGAGFSSERVVYGVDVGAGFGKVELGAVFAGVVAGPWGRAGGCAGFGQVGPVDVEVVADFDVLCG